MKYYFADRPQIEKARIFPPHVHDELEIYVLIEGDASFMVENELYKLTSGDVIIAKPNEMHNCILNTNSVHKHICFWFDPSCEFLFGEFLKKGIPNNNLITPSETDKQTLNAVYEKLKDASEKNDVKRRFYTALEMLNILEKNIGNAKKLQPVPELLSAILDDVNAHFTEINSLDYFTEKYFISQSTLNRLFKTYLFTSPKLYLETKRLAYSRLLLNEGKSVFEACMLSGFPDYSNYIRLFKSRFGITPRQYRNK